MIELARTIKDADKIAAWLEEIIRPKLSPDVSNYAKGRLRCWLRTEPTLAKDFTELPGIPIKDTRWDRLKEIVEWDFDYCLVTYSGDIVPHGILPHRDASYADYEAYGLHLTGESRFDYWQGKDSFGYSKDARWLTPGKDDPTDSFILEPGDLVRFNCKNIHAANPGPKRWNMNFWKRKPEK